MQPLSGGEGFKVLGLFEFSDEEGDRITGFLVSNERYTKYLFNKNIIRKNLSYQQDWGQKR